ncbi:MAG: SulP family inorganic anion transporter [Chloroflexota bacterium]
MTSSKSVKTGRSFQIAWPRPFVALRGIDRADWPREILAGITLAALVIPLNIGYAEVAGLPPQVGLYAGIVPMIAYAIFATSRHVVASPDAAIAALIGSLLAVLAVPGSQEYLQLAYALALVCAAFFTLFWLFRLGFLANYLSRAVLVGLIAGLGIEVLFSQVRKMMGVSIEAEGFFREVLATLQAFTETNWYSLAIGLSTIAIVRLLKRFTPKIPGALVALIGMTLVVSVFNLTAYGVSVLGEIPAGLPRLTVPQVAFSEWVKLVPGALAIVALTIAEGLLLARRYAQSHGYKVDSDQEEFAYGMANMAGGFTGSFVTGSSASRTAAMDEAGARTQWPSVVSAVLVVMVLLFFTEQLALLPTAALAGIVANAVLKLIDIEEFRELYRLRRSEFMIALVCTVSLLVLGTLAGLTIAFLLTTIEVVRRAAQPKTNVLVELPDAESLESSPLGEHQFSAPDIIVYRFGGPLFFANAHVLREEVEDIIESGGGTLECLILDVEAVNDIDTTGVEVLEQVIKLVQAKGIYLAVSRAHSPVPDMLRRYGLMEHLGEENLFTNNRQAIKAFKARKRE